MEIDYETANLIETCFEDLETQPVMQDSIGIRSFNPGDKVRWIKGSRLAGFTGVVAESNGEWTFVNLCGAERQEYKKTALLELLPSRNASSPQPSP